MSANLSAKFRLLLSSTLVCASILFCSFRPANASDKISWQSKAITAGKADVVTGGYQIRRMLGVARFSPEFVIPVELVYNSELDKTGMFGYRWSCPQLESRAFPKPDSVEWIAPWGEKVSFYSRRKARTEDGMQEVHGEQIEGKGYFSPYSDWEAKGSRGDWKIRGRENKDFYGWEFTYKDSRLSKIESPSGRNIRFNYTRNGELTSVEQGSTKFIQIKYRNGNISSATIGGVKTDIDMDTIKVRHLPEEEGQEILVNEMPTIAMVKQGELQAEKFHYSKTGWLCKTECGKLIDEMTIESESAGEYLARIRSDKKQDEIKKEYKTLLAQSQDDTQTEAFRKEALRKAKLLDEMLTAMKAKKNAPTKIDGRLRKDRLFEYGYEYGKKDLSGVSVKRCDGESAKYSYNVETGVLQITDFSGREQSIYYYRRYDVAYNGKLREVVDAKGRPVANYRYDNDTGNLIRVRTLTGNETHYSYDKKNRLTGVSRLEVGSQNPLRQLTSVSYDRKNNPETISMLDSKGQVVYTVRFDHDKRHQLKSVKTPEGTSRYEYTADGWPKTSTDRFGRTSRKSYDRYNRLTESKNAYGVETRVKYNKNGQIENIVRVKPFFSTAEGEKLKKETVVSSLAFNYDGMGQVVSVTDHRGRTKKYDRNAEGRIIKEYFPDDTAIEYAYTALGQLSKVTDRNGHAINFSWSKFGSLENRTTAAGQESIYEYDKYGLIQGLSNVNTGEAMPDRSFSYKYDEFDRVVSIDFGGQTSKELSYDKLGRLSKAVTLSWNEKVTLNLSYDDFDRVVKRMEKREPREGEEGKTEITLAEYSFTATGKRQHAKITFPDGRVTKMNYAYDDSGRLSAITQNGRTLAYEYDDLSRVSTQNIAGTEIRYVYDNEGRLTEKFVADGSSKNGKLASLKYFYTTDGEITAREVNGRMQKFEYDMRGQLLAVKDESGKDVERYIYDAAGNVLSKTVFGRTTTFTYDKANQLLSAKLPDGTTKDFAYDAAGRMIKEGDREYEYGWLDKVTEVSKDGEMVAAFSYNSDGQIASIKREKGESETLYWDGLAMVRRNGKNYLNEPYATGGNPVLAWDDVVKAEAKEAATRLLFNDMLGSTVAIFEGEDKKADAICLTLFGEGAKGDETFFTGKPNIKETGYAFLFRNYRSEFGKWHTADLAGYPDGWNQLAYVNNQPVLYFDLVGLLQISYTPDPVLHHASIEAWRLNGTKELLYAPLGSDGAASGSYPTSSEYAQMSGGISVLGNKITVYSYNWVNMPATYRQFQISASYQYRITITNDTTTTNLYTIDSSISIDQTALGGQGVSPTENSITLNPGDSYSFTAVISAGVAANCYTTGQAHWNVMTQITITETPE